MQWDQEIPILQFSHDFSAFASLSLWAAFWVISSLESSAPVLLDVNLLLYLAIGFLMSMIIIFISRHCVVLFVYPSSRIMDGLSYPISWVLFKQHRYFASWFPKPCGSQAWASPSFLCGPGFFCFAFQGFHIYTRFSEQISWDSCLKISPCCLGGYPWFS